MLMIWRFQEQSLENLLIEDPRGFRPLGHDRHGRAGSHPRHVRRDAIRRELPVGCGATFAALNAQSLGVFFLQTSYIHVVKFAVHSFLLLDDLSNCAFQSLNLVHF